MPMSALLLHLPAVGVGEPEVQDIRQGRPVRPPEAPQATGTDEGQGRVRLLSGGALVALARPMPGQPGLLHADIVLI